jgi:hypothetical protein
MDYNNRKNKYNMVVNLPGEVSNGRNDGVESIKKRIF